MYTGTWLATVIHRRLLSQFFLREGGCLYTGYAHSCLFRKRLLMLPFLGHLKNLKKIATQDQTQISNLNLSYPNLSPLPLHHHTDQNS